MTKKTYSLGWPENPNFYDDILVNVMRLGDHEKLRLIGDVRKRMSLLLQGIRIPGMQRLDQHVLVLRHNEELGGDRLPGRVRMDGPPPEAGTQLAISGHGVWEVANVRRLYAPGPDGTLTPGEVLVFVEQTLEQ